MTKDTRINRIVCHEVSYGKGGVVTSLTVESDERNENEDRHIPMVSVTVEYSGLPRHRVGDPYPDLSGLILHALGVA
jgi:hypothetical protein